MMVQHLSPVPFWLVWCPTGTRPPTYRHPSVHSAKQEAERLAWDNPGKVFYVLQPFSSSVAQSMITTQYELEDGVPF